MHRTIVSCMAAVALAWPALAQPVFESRDAMRVELNDLLRERAFVATMERFSPPDTISVGRIRVLEDRYRDALAPFEQSTHLYREDLAPGMVREVVAYWADEVYIYVYILSHAREDDVRILDFRMSGDIREVSRWIWTGQLN